MTTASRTAMSATAPPDVADSIAQSLVHDILAGRYAPGDRLLSERDLAERYGVNRNTAREALKQLESLRLVTIRRGDGPRVNPIGDASLETARYLLDAPRLDKRTTLNWLLDMHEVWIVGAAHFMVERASEETLAQADQLLKQIRRRREPEAYFTQLAQLVDLMFAATHNPVAKMARSTLLFDIFATLPADGAQLRPPRRILNRHIAELRGALGNRDPVAVAESVRSILRENRARVSRFLDREAA